MFDVNSNDLQRLRTLQGAEKRDRQKESDRERLRGILQRRRDELADATAARKADQRAKGRRVRAAHRRGLVRRCAHEWQLERCVKYIPHVAVLAQFLGDCRERDGGDRLGPAPTNNHLLVFGLVVAAELLGWRGVFARQAFIGELLGISGRTVARAEIRLRAYGLLHAVSNYDPAKTSERSQQAHSYVVSPLGQLLLQSIRADRTQARAHAARPHVAATSCRPQPKTVLLENSALKTTPTVDVGRNPSSVDGGSVASTSPGDPLSASDGACWAQQMAASFNGARPTAPQRRSDGATDALPLAEQLELIEAAIAIRDSEDPEG